MYKLNYFLFLLISPYFIKCEDYVCIESDNLISKIYTESYFSFINSSNVENYVADQNTSDVLQAFNARISRQHNNNLNRNTFTKLNNARSIESIPIYKFTYFTVPRFVYNHNVLMLQFQVPQDTTEISLIFLAHETNVRNTETNCQAKSVELFLKPLSYPISNISMPENYITSNREVQSIIFQSNTFVQTLRIKNPTIGFWYARVYQSWTNPKDDQIGQQGLTSGCETYLSGQVTAHVQNNIEVIDCENIVPINVASTTSIQTDIYKCFIRSESSEHTVQLNINMSEDIDFLIIKMDGKKFISEESPSRVECAVRVDQVNQLISFTFTPHINEWHYLGIIYGVNTSYPSLGDVQICEDIQYETPPRTQVTTLTRVTRNSVFSFNYELLEFSQQSINMSSTILHTYKYQVNPATDTGGVLSIATSLNNDGNAVRVVVCFGLDRIVLPTSDNLCQFDSNTIEPNIIVSNDGSTTKSKAVHFPFPEMGVWYVTFGVFCDITPCVASVNFRISSSACSNTDCGKFGSCNIILSGSILYSSCRCTSDFTGWLCSDEAHIMSIERAITSILLLTLSNLVFIPSVVFAIRRQYYTEAVVYTFTMFFSTFYHACDGSNAYYGLCIMSYGVLQYADFFCGILAFWVTLVAMASVNRKFCSILQITGAILIAFGTTWNRFSVIVFTVPLVTGIILVIISWVVHCRQSGKLFPGKKYLMFLFPAGIVLSVIGLVCFAFLQTNANYYIVHSIWHVSVALSILLLLPIRSIFFTDEFNAGDSADPFNTVLESR